MNPKRPLELAFALALATSAWPGVANAQTTSPAPAAPAPSPAATTVDPAVTALAKEWYHRVQTSDIDRSKLTPEADAAFTSDAIKSVAANVAPLGDPTAFTFVNSRTVADNTIYVYKVTFKSGTLIYVLGLNAAGKISGLRLIPQNS